jgi:hypothetical protein
MIAYWRKVRLDEADKPPRLTGNDISGPDLKHAPDIYECTVCWPMNDELTIGDVRKELREIEQARGNPKAAGDISARVQALAARILRHISIYGDTQTRALMAVYLGLSKP